VAPTREARHGRVYTLDGDMNLRRAEFANDERPLDPECDCPTCTENHTRAELRAMQRSHEPDEKAHALTLLSQHNVRFIIRLTEQIRAAIIDGTFDELKNTWLKRYYNVN
jgi:queuine tRNA-ribosyltransferase